MRRITGPWTAAVHKLLKAYEQARVRHVPAVLWDPIGLTAAAVLLCNLRDASLQLLAPELVWRQPRRIPDGMNPGSVQPCAGWQH